MATESKVTGLTAEDYLKNKEWVTRIEFYFDSCDSDKDGVLTINDLVYDIKKISHLNPDPKVIESFRQAQIDLAAEVGVKPGISATKEEFVKSYAALAPREVAKMRSGEGSIMHKLLNRMFDVIDTDHDGTVSKERLREFAIASGQLSPESSDLLFEVLDTNKNGKLERKEINDFKYKATFTLEKLPAKAEAFAKAKFAKH